MTEPIAIFLSHHLDAANYEKSLEKSLEILDFFGSGW